MTVRSRAGQRLRRGLLPLLVLGPAIIRAQPPVPAATPVAPAASLDPVERARIDSVFQDYDKPDVPGCALGVFAADAMAYARGYGLADLERRVPITPTTLFDIGSTSKQFAAATIALLAEDGKLAFSDDIRKYIPELPVYGRPITIDHLMRHTSGLRDYVGLLVLAGHGLEEATTDSQALALIVRQRHLNFPTGSRYEYSNTGYFLLSVIVQRVTRRPLADVARERIFEPLGMTATRYRNHFAMLIPNRALGYAPDSAGGFQNSMSNWEQTGDGSVQLSIVDALKWDQNFYHPRVGGQTMVDELQARGTLDNGDSLKYARGLEIERYRGLRRVEHGGDWIGYHAAFNRFPDQHTSIIVLCNSDGIEPTELADRVADIVLASDLTPTTHASPGPPPAMVSGVEADSAGRFAGSYFVATTGQVLRVIDSAGALTLHLGDRKFLLQKTGPSAFAVSGLPVSVRFTTNASGPARSLQLEVGSDAEPPAERFTPATPTPAQLRDYIGRYYSPELDVAWPIALHGGRLVIEIPRPYGSDNGGPLQPAMRDAFTAASGYLRFNRDSRGRVTGFDLSASRMRGIHFEVEPYIAGTKSSESSRSDEKK